MLVWVWLSLTIRLWYTICPKLCPNQSVRPYMFLYPWLRWWNSDGFEIKYLYVTWPRLAQLNFDGAFGAINEMKGWSVFQKFTNRPISWNIYCKRSCKTIQNLNLPINKNKQLQVKCANKNSYRKRILRKANRIRDCMQKWIGINSALISSNGDQ